MLALRKDSTPIAEGGARRAPHCRTCGKAMRGHNKALCQLRSPSEESRAGSTLGSIFEDAANQSLPSTPPLTPTATSKSRSPPPPLYPDKPLSLEPSWEAPPEGTYYHRRNPYIANPFSQVVRGTPLQRTASWISTERADSDFGHQDDDNDDPFSSTLKPAARPRVNVARVAALPLTPPTTPANSQNANNVARGGAPPPERQVDVIDASGTKVVGLDISTLSDNFKSIINQADSAGYYAAIVRPRIGYNRGSVDIRTSDDADKHTTIFVATAPDTMSINVMCSEAVRKARLVAEGGANVRGTSGWLSVFLATLFASLISIWASLFVIRIFW